MNPPTPTEIKVAELMALGLGNVEIRERLSMRPAQVTGYVSKIRARLGWQAV